MLYDEHGDELATWRQIVELTKAAGLRPALPEGIDPTMGALINECWHHDPAVRPSFAVIRQRLLFYFVGQAGTRGRDVDKFLSSQSMIQAAQGHMWVVKMRVGVGRGERD